MLVIVRRVMSLGKVGGEVPMLDLTGVLTRERLPELTRFNYDA